VEESGFARADQIEDINVLREDYEKLRLAYELSKLSVTVEVNKLLAKSLDLMFEILPIDRGVVLLVDSTTGFLSTHYVKLGAEQAKECKEILLSSTIIHKVFYSRKCVITSDAMDDPLLGLAASVRHGQIRSVICVPLISHDKVYGILHLDAKNRINSFSSKDLSLVKAISNQTAIVIENMNLIKEVEAKAKMTEQLSRFLPPHVVDRMTTRSDMIRTGGREMVGTIIFADIRGFTKLSEKSNPMEVVNLLNDYFERLVKIVFKYDGVVDKYIGDELMAVFGTIEEEPDPEYRAVAAGIEFQTAISQMNRERQLQHKEPIAIGVGINTGVLLAGFIGSSQRLEYTCIGDTVNTSSRICGLAEGESVLIGESTYEKVRDFIECQQIGSKQVKGKDKGVMVYRAMRVKGNPRSNSGKGIGNLNLSSP
jgi:adenylate cyclase